MKITDQISYYDQLWSKRKLMNSLQLMRAIQMLKYFNIVKRKIKQPKILDLGCGDGRFTSFVGEFGDMDAIELSQDAVKHASEQHPHVRFFQGDANTYPFNANTYDIVFSQEVIEHIEDQNRYLDVCANVLKQNGYLIITTPNKRVIDHMKGGNWSKQPIENILTPGQFKKLIRKNFKIIAYDNVVFNFGRLGYFGILNHRLIVGACNRLKLNRFRDYIYSKLGFGLHQCVLAKKR